MWMQKQRAKLFPQNHAVETPCAGVSITLLAEVVQSRGRMNTPVGRGSMVGLPGLPQLLPLPEAAERIT